MGLYHTEDQAMLKDSVAPFLAENGSIKQLRSLRDSNDATGFARDLWSQFAEMGLNGILIPEAEGGLGLGHVEAGIVLEEIGRKRGALRPGGRIDLHKASELLLHEFRSGKIGLLSLETPAMAEIEKIEVERIMAEKEQARLKKLELSKLKQSGKRHQG